MLPGLPAAMGRGMAIPRVSGAQRVGLMKVVSNAELNRVDEQQRMLAQQVAAQPELYRLSSHIEKFWQSAQSAKLPIERQMLRALRLREGVYEPDELAAIREQGGSEIFMMITSAKCRGFEAWMREILLPDSGERPWGLEATPMPDLPPNVKQAIVQSVAAMAVAAGWDVEDARVDEKLLKLKAIASRKVKELADKIAERHENVIADEFAEGAWEEAVSNFIYDLATFPSAIIKGPVLRQAMDRVWMPGPGGQWVSQVTKRIRMEWERRSPFDFYPAPAMRDIRYGNFIDRYRFKREELLRMRGVPSYSDEAINAILTDYGEKGYSSRLMSDTQRAILEMRPNEQFDPEGTIEALNFWGSVSGRMVLDWGFKTGVNVEETGPLKAENEYQIEAWKTGRYIFKAQINPDALGERPYSITSFEKIPDSVWGLGIPDVMLDCQRMSNGAARALSNNMAIASGPQVEVNVDRLADGERVGRPYPWKLTQTTTDMTGNNQPAVRYFQPQSNAQELMMIYDKFSGEADNVTGVPRYTYGDSRVGGAGRTSSGLAQLLGTVGKGIKRVVGFTDRDIFKPNVLRSFEFNMEFHPDNSIKGDLRAVTKGTAAALLKDQVAMRQREVLQATMNPVDMAIIGAKGRREMLRPILRNADFPVDDILPDDLELALIQASTPPMHELAGGQGPNAPADGGMPPGMSPGGGTPDGGDNVDNAGQPVQGQVIRKQNLGYVNGGIVKGVGRWSSDDYTARRRGDDDLDAGL